MLRRVQDHRQVSAGRSFAMRAGLAAIGSTLLASSAQAALVGVCSGVSLPRSVVTGIIAGPLNGIATPVQGTVNTLLGALTGLPLIGGVLNPLLPAPLSIDVTGLLATAASGAPITLQALATDGTIVGPADNCQATADSFTLDTPAGISIGGNSITGLGSGTAASAGSLGAIALGNNASTAAAATNSIALGTNASATAANSVAIGAGSTATRGAVAGYAAPGLVAPQTSAGEVSVGAPGAERQITNVAAGSAPTDAVNVSQVSAAITASAGAAPVQYSNAGTPTTPNGGVPTNDVTLVGAAAGPVTLHNVAPGVLAAGSTDAVNGGQLFTTNQQVTTNTNNITSNTTAIAGNTTSITNLNNGTTGIVRQVGGAPGAGVITVGAQTGGTVVDMTGTSGTRVVTGVTAGGLGAGSTDAVNGSQLFATNTNVTNNANATTNLTNNITNGTIGLVQQTGGSPGAGQITVGAATGGTSLSVGGTAGTRTISDVSAGVAATDAVNVAQLAAVGAGAANAVLYDVVGGVRQNSATLVGGAPGPVEINNLADGTIAAGSTDAVNGGQLFTTNQNVATNTTNIATNTANISTNTTNLGNLTTSINNGTVGLLQQVGGAPGAGLLTVGAATGGTAVSFAGTSGNRRLTDVADGIAISDAATVGQLGALAGTTANSVLYDTVGGVRQNSITLAGGAAGTVAITNLSAGTLAAGSTDAVNGGQLFAISTGVGSVTTVLGGTYNPVTGVYTGPTYNTFGGTTATTIQGAFDNYNTTLGSLTSGMLGPVQYSGAPNTLVLVAPGGTGAAPGAAQVLGNVASGVAATDAVNVSQLSGAVGSATANALQYDTVGGVRQNTVTLAGGAAGPVTVTNVAAGVLNAGSTDAVNGAQLFATNQQVTTNTTNIANNTTDIANLTTNINNGSVGLVQQTGGSPGSGAITVGSTTGGTTINVAGTGGDRIITGVAPGLAANDAATVGQLAMVTGGAFNAVQYDTDIGGGRLNSITLAGGAAGPVSIFNVANGTVAAGSTDAVNGGQLAAVSATVTGNTTTINNIVNGQAGAFRSDNTAGVAPSSATGANSASGGFGASATGVRSVAIGNSSTSSGTNSVALGAGSTDGGVSNVVSVGSAGAERRLTNVGPGLNGTDAVNLSQLQAATNSFQTTTNGLQGQINQLDFDLNRTKRRANAGTAGALAIAGLPQPFTEGAGMVAGGVGYWQGQVAFAVGVSKIVSDKVIVKAGASVSGRGTAGGNAGVGFQF